MQYLCVSYIHSTSFFKSVPFLQCGPMVQVLKGKFLRESFHIPKPNNQMFVYFFPLRRGLPRPIYIWEKPNLVASKLTYSLRYIHYVRYSLCKYRRDGWNMVGLTLSDKSYLHVKYVLYIIHIIYIYYINIYIYI